LFKRPQGWEEEAEVRQEREFSGQRRRIGIGLFAQNSEAAERVGFADPRPVQDGRQFERNRDVTARGSAAPTNADFSLACRIQQVSDGALDLVILTFAGMAEDDIAALVNDVLGRPILIAPSVPRR
jgi:hypothetical protein